MPHLYDSFIDSFICIIHMPHSMPHSYASSHELRSSQLTRRSRVSVNFAYLSGHTKSCCVINTYVWVCVSSYFRRTYICRCSCAHELVLRDQQLCMSMRMFIFLGAHVYIFRCSCAHDLVCPRSRAVWSAHMYGESLSYVWHDLIMCVTWLDAMLHMAHDMPHPNVTLMHSYVTWLVHMWHWRIRMWHDSFIRDMTHSCVTWLMHMWHDSFICDMTHSHVTWLIHMSRDSFIRGMTPRLGTHHHIHTHTHTHTHAHTESRCVINIYL